MAAFDPVDRKIVVRVVYDGPGQAGKTTNLEQLEGFFTERRRSDLFDAGCLDGRTQYFEWMQLEGGLVQGHPLRCELISVPGQTGLGRRREHVLRHADAVVLVCESTARGIEEARSFLGGASGPWLVVQANKQDLDGALSPDEVRLRLALDAAVPVVSARACSGFGVKETAVLAIRGAANQIEQLLLDRGIDALEQRRDTPGSLLEAIMGLESPTANSLQRRWPALVVRPILAVGRRTGVTPPFPSADAAPEHVWPAQGGRETLRRLALAGTPVQASGASGGETVVYEAGLWCLKSSLGRRYPDPEVARTALQALARRKASLGDFLPRHTALCLEKDSSGSHWLWTVCPWLGTLRSALDHAAKRGDSEELGRKLELYAEAAIRAIALAARERVLLDVHPSNFADAGGQLVYLDDDIAEGDGSPTFGHALLHRVAEYDAFPAAVARYCRALEDGLTAISAAEASRSGLAQALISVPIRSLAVARVQGALLDVLERA